MKTIVVLPTYNEAENLPYLVKSLLALPIEDLRLLIVDDNSPDGTGRIADELATQHRGKIEVIHRPGKRGLGTAYVLGFTRAIRDGADRIVQMDSDFSHDPTCIPPMLARLAEFDIVVGSRYTAGGGVDPNWSWFRKLLSRWGSFYSRTVLGITLHDTTGGFRCYRRAALEKLNLDAVVSNGYAFQIEIAYVCQRKGLQSCEYPILFADRTRGRSKMSARIALEASFRVWQIKWRY